MGQPKPELTFEEVANNPESTATLRCTTTHTGAATNEVGETVSKEYTVGDLVLRNEVVGFEAANWELSDLTVTA